MRYLLAMIISIISASLFCVKACADVSYADLFLARKGYKPVDDAWIEKPVIPHSPNQRWITGRHPLKQDKIKRVIAKILYFYSSLCCLNWTLMAILHGVGS